MDDAGYEVKVESTVGAQLRAARELRGLTLADIAERTRIPLRHLSAIDASDYAQLPAATYSAGFVRTYARLVGLDAHDLSQRFRGELAQIEPVNHRRQESYEPADPARVPSRGLVWVTLLLVVLVAAGYLYWRGTQIENPAAVATDTPSEPTVAAVPTPQPVTVPQQAQSAAAAAASDDTAVLTAQEPVWIRVTDAGGSKLFEGMLKAGDHFQVPATAADPRLRTGRATVLKVAVGSVTIPPLGPPETLIKDVSLKPDALLARSRLPAAAAEPVSAPAR